MARVVHRAKRLLGALANSRGHRHEENAAKLVNAALEIDLTGQVCADSIGHRLLSGVGNAYSDEILHRAGLSPVAQTHKLGPGEVLRLYASARSVLTEWTLRLRDGSLMRSMRLAGIIVEPLVQGAGGMLFHDDVVAERKA